MAEMEVEDADDVQTVEWTIADGEEVQCETSDGPLMVAMQPGVDVSAVEVVVVTESGEPDIQDGGLPGLEQETHMVTLDAVGAMEEVKEDPGEDLEEWKPPSERPRPARRTGTRPIKPTSRLSPTLPPARTPTKVRMLKRPRKDSTSSSESPDSDDSSDGPSSSKRKPKKRDFAYRLQWRNKDMLEAMKMVLEKKITIRGAAKKFRVPYSTLKDRIHGRVQHGTKPGVKTALSPEEEEDLVRYVKDMESAGFQMRCIDVRVRAGEILNLNHGHNSPYNDCSPGHNWLAGFLKRHTGMEFKKAINRVTVPSIQKQKVMCRTFYEACDRLYKKYRILQKPERIFAVAELRISSVLDATVLMAASADGETVAPFVIFPGQKMKMTSARQAYPEAFFTNSADGRVTDVILLWWFRDHFLKQLPAHIQRPIILLMDRPVCEVTFQFMQIAREEKVHIISIPTGVSHLLHPIDDGIGKSIENQITKRARKWEDENPATPFTQKILAQILQKVWRKNMCSRDIVNKFAQNGVYPPNHVVMTMERISVATQAMKQERPPPPSYGKEMFSGLNLLSALSSHEYASLDRIMAGEGTSQVPVTPKQETTTPKILRRRSSQEERVLVKLNRRLEQERVIDEEDRTDDYNELMSENHQPKLMVSMIHPEPEKTEEMKPEDEGTEDEERGIHQELVAARDNRDQIDRAVESIGGLIAMVGTSQMKEENGQPAMITEVTQVTEQEVVEEIVQDGEFYENGDTHEGEQSEVVESEEVHQDMMEIAAEGENSLEQVVEQNVVYQEDLMQQNTIPVMNPESGEIHYIPEGIDPSQIQFVDSNMLASQQYVGQTEEYFDPNQQYVTEEQAGYVQQEFVQQQDVEYHQVETEPVQYHQMVDSNHQVVTDEDGQRFILQNTVPEVLQEEPVIQEEVQEVHTETAAGTVSSQGISPEALQQIMQQLGQRTPTKDGSSSSAQARAPSIKQIRIVRPKLKPKPAASTSQPRQRVIRIVQPKGRKLSSAQLQQIARQVLPEGATGRIVVQESGEDQV